MHSFSQHLFENIFSKDSLLTICQLGLEFTPFFFQKWYTLFPWSVLPPISDMYVSFPLVHISVYLYLFTRSSIEIHFSSSRSHQFVSCTQLNTPRHLAVGRLLFHDHDFLFQHQRFENLLWCPWWQVKKWQGGVLYIWVLGHMTGKYWQLIGWKLCDRHDVLYQVIKILMRCTLYMFAMSHDWKMLTVDWLKDMWLCSHCWLANEVSYQLKKILPSTKACNTVDGKTICCLPVESLMP